MPNTPTISDLAAAWPKRASIFRDPNEFRAYQTEVQVLGAIQQQLAAHSAGIANITNTTIVQSGPGGSASSGVTSVGLSAPTQFAVSGSPITSFGTLALAWNTQTANYGLFGPTSGSAAAPTFRALVLADLPSIGLGNLSNVVLTSPANGQVLEYNGTDWVNASPAAGTVTSVGLSAPTQFAVSGSPVSASGTLALAWNTQTANYGLFGPTSGSAAAPTFRALVLADLPSIALGNLSNVVLTTPSNGQLLQFNGTNWVNATVSGSGSPGGSNTQVQFNASGSFSGDAGFTYGGVGGSVLVTLNPTSTSAVVLKGTAPASFAGSVLQWLDSSSAVNAQLSQTTTNTLFEILSPSGNAIPSSFRSGINTYQSGGNSGIGGIAFGVAISGSWSSLATIQAISAEAQSSGHLGTSINLFATPTASTSEKNYWQLGSQGDFVANNTGSAPATSTTGQFVWLPACAGVPSGTPALSPTGAVATIGDTSDNVLFLYNATAGVWQDHSGGTVVTATNPSIAIPATSKIILLNFSLGSIAATLPAAANYIGHELIIRVSPATAAAHVCTVSAAGSDKIYDTSGTAVSPTIGSGGTYTKYLRLTATASGVWATTGGA